MRRIELRVVIVIALALTWVGVLPSCATPADAAAFTFVSLGEKVWLARPTATDRAHANSLVVERADGLLIVDAQPTRAAARELLSALDGRFEQDVRFLVLSQPYFDATGGAAEFDESVLVIGSNGCLEAMIDPEFDGAAPAGSLAPDTTRPPSFSIGAKSTLHGGGPRIDLLPVGHARTSGDLIVQLPEARVVYLGGLTFHEDRNPFAGNAKFGRWLAILNDVISGPDWTVVGAGGDAIRPFDLRPLRDGLAWTRSEVARAWIDKIPTDEMPARVLSLPEAKKYYDLDARPSNLHGLVERIVEESVVARRKRGQL